MEASKIGQILIKKVPTMEETIMETLWENNDCVIIFFRRFGCLFCRQSAKEISLLGPVLEKNGVRFVGIGMDQMGLDEFVAENYFGGELFIDPARENYKALGFKKLGYATALKSMFKKKAREVIKKAREGGVKEGELTQGDGFQSGGAIVVSKSGSEVLFSFKQDNPADFVSNTDILNALGLDEEIE